jgi:hypothetical protein
MSNKISEVFDLEPVKETLPPVVVDDNSVSEDIEEARANLKQLISTGNKALEYALDVAMQSESPRAFEVLTNMIKTLGDMNAQILDIHEKGNKITTKDKPQNINATQNNVTNNVVFKGTPADLATFIENMNNKDKG